MGIFDWLFRRGQKDKIWSCQSRQFHKALRYLDRQKDFTFDIYVKLDSITSGETKPREELQKQWEQMLTDCRIMRKEPRDFFRDVLVRGVQFSVFAADHKGEIE
jgi:hypothetical protein